MLAQNANECQIWTLNRNGLFGRWGVTVLLAMARVRMRVPWEMNNWLACMWGRWVSPERAVGCSLGFYSIPTSPVKHFFQFHIRSDYHVSNIKVNTAFFYCHKAVSVLLFSVSKIAHLSLRPLPPLSCVRNDWQYRCCHGRMYAHIDSANSKVSLA